MNSKGHVLIVDDEKNIVSSLKGILSDEAYTVSTAEDGKQALDIIESRSPDLVLLDIWIPGMDGLQTLETIKNKQSGIEIIMMSGHGSIDTAVKATKLGAFDFIEKPLSLESVLLTVSRAMKYQKENRTTGNAKFLKPEKSARTAEKSVKTEVKSPRRIVKKEKTGAAANMVMQSTLKRSVVLCGQGLHSGIKTGLILSPLPVNSGIIFEDISTGEQIHAHINNVESTTYATSMKKKYWQIKTIEHIMAVLHMYGIHNLLIKVGEEVPAMDGSAIDFCRLIEDGGVEEQKEMLDKLVIKERIVFSNPAKGSRGSISIEPHPKFSIEYTLDYPVPVGKQKYAFLFESEKDFRENIAPARTFVFLKDYEKLLDMGLAGGGKLSNVILVDNEKVINTPLRFPDEFVRHKILDIIGDFYLLGRPIKGKISASMSGHAENISLVKKLRKQYNL